MTKKIKFSLLIATLFLSAPLAHAFYFGASEGVVNNEVIKEDSYLAGKSIYIEEAIEGDAFLAGESVVVNANIAQDAMMAGQSIEMNASIQDDLRMAGENIEISGRVGGDLMILGSKIKIKPSSVVEESVLFAGENFSLEGLVKGDLIGGSSKLYLNGVVEGNVKLNYSDQIILGPGAKIMGNLNYVSPEKNPELEALTIGKITHEKLESKPLFSKNFFLRISLSFIIFSFLSALLIGLILIAGLRYFGYRMTQATMKNPLKSFGSGALFIFALPALVGILMGTIAGIPLGLILIFTWFILIYVTKILASMVVAVKLFKLKEGAEFGQRFLTFTLVLAIYDGLTLVPVLGMINENGTLVALGSLIGTLKIAIAVLSLGGLMLYKVELFKAMRGKKLI